MTPMQNVQAPTEEDIALRVSTLTPGQLIGIHLKKPIAEALFTSVSNRIRNLTPEQLQAVGYKVVPSQRSKVKDIRLFAKLAIENGLITREQFIEICDIVLDRLVKIAVPRLKESGIATQKAATERIKQVLEPAMQKYDIAPRIVRTNEQQKEIK